MAPRPNPHEDQIVFLRQSGLWPTEIAKRLGVTRNSVIGICYRAGLSRADTDKSEILRKTVPRGESHHHSKLTEQQVAEIRRSYRMCNRALDCRNLAERFGVSAKHIYAVATNRSWRVG